MSPSVPSLRPRRSLLALAVLAASLGGATTSAHGAVQAWSGTDPVGDTAGTPQPGLDLVSAEVTYDNTAGTYTASIGTSASGETTNHALRVIVGKLTAGACAFPQELPEGTPPFFQFFSTHITGIDDNHLWARTSVATAAPEAGLSVATRSGAKLDLTATAPGLAAMDVECVLVETFVEESTPDELKVLTADAMVVLVKTAGSKAPVGGGSSPAPGDGGKTDPAQRTPVKVVTADVDADRDGTPDRTDTCPTVPGAGDGGCAAVPTRSEFRLGAKRVVLDKLVARTGASCPTSVKVVVTSKGKRVGAAKLVVDQYGSFCRVSGIVRLKKRRAAVRVVAKGKGMGGIAKSVRKPA